MQGPGLLSSRKDLEIPYFWSAKNSPAMGELPADTQPALLDPAQIPFDTSTEYIRSWKEVARARFILLRAHMPRLL